MNTNLHPALRFVLTTVICFTLVTLAQFAVAAFTGGDFDPNWTMNAVMAMAGAFGEWIGNRRRLKRA